ncbi:MAG: hypothetical protein EOP48_18765 [Sphingobacteriales bacterium]|nr:MAG: hypothetical protein EOP48_18765 [Sphingobacteriales bacterium]
MSKMYAEISRIVNEDISSRVTQYDVLFESITNSIHANATEITVLLKSNDSLLTENGIELTTFRLDEITVVDNGDGITDTNYKSFSTYRTEHKKDLGCKGVGRFVFLKVYNNVTYLSKLSSLQEERQIKFHMSFDTEDLEIHEKEISENETRVMLSGLTSKYFEPDRKIDRRIPLDIYLIRQKVLMNLIPTLFFYQKVYWAFLLNASAL